MHRNASRPPRTPSMGGVTWGDDAGARRAGIRVFLAVLLGAGLLDGGAMRADPVHDSGSSVPREPAWARFDLKGLRARRAAAGSAYLPFLRTETLRAGLYELPAGATDPQPVHALDEIYNVLAGEGTLVVGADSLHLQAGSIAYVHAGVPHRFVDIREDLSVLVIFSTADPGSPPTTGAPDAAARGNGEP